MAEVGTTTFQHHSESKAWHSYCSAQPILRIGSMSMLASKLFYIYNKGVFL